MDFSTIRTRIRNKSGWSSTDDLSNAKIDEAINYVYTRKIVHELNWQGLQDWVYLELSQSDGLYLFTDFVDAATGGASLGTRVRSFYPPLLLLIDDDQTITLDYTENRDAFWKAFPPYANEGENVPSNVLKNGKQLFVRPLPDGSYVIKAWANLRPVELAADNDEPIEDWSQAIIAGAVAMLAEEDEETDKALLYWGIFTDRLKDEVANEYSAPPGKVKGQW